MKNQIVILLLSVIFLGCSNVNLKPTTSSKKHLAYNDNNHRYADRDYKYYLEEPNPNVGDKEKCKRAIENYIYALMSSNAYDDNPYFKLDDFGYERVGRYKAWNGFSVDIYKNESKNEVVMAFRGTEGLLNPFSRDNIFANFSLGFDGQYKSARKLVDIIIEQYRPKYTLKAIGHSLGGGLAIHSALYKDGITAITFNTSPRIFNKKEFPLNKNKIYIIVEDGELLGKVRKKFTSLDQIKKNITSIEYDFIDDKIEHNSYRFARGILKVAATAEYSNTPEYKGNNKYPEAKDIGALDLMENKMTYKIE